MAQPDVGGSRVPGQPFALLFVCTGNTCRSPMAELISRALLDRALGPAAEEVTVTSAGTAAEEGSPMHPHSALALRRLGYAPGDFAARKLAPADVMSADLVLTMTSAQRSEVLTLAPRALARTFTLLEAAALIPMVARGVPPGASFPDRATVVVGQMARLRSRRNGRLPTDIPDPIGQPEQAHHLTASTIAAQVRGLLTRLVILTGDPAPHGDGPGHASSALRHGR